MIFLMQINIDQLLAEMCHGDFFFLFRPILGKFNPQSTHNKITICITKKNQIHSKLHSIKRITERYKRIKNKFDT